MISITLLNHVSDTPWQNLWPQSTTASTTLKLLAPANMRSLAHVITEWNTLHSLQVEVHIYVPTIDKQRAMAMENSKKGTFRSKKKHKARFCRYHQNTKSEKEVTGKVLACSCHTFTSATTATALYNKWHYLATWPTFLKVYTIRHCITLEAITEIFM